MHGVRKRCCTGQGGHIGVWHRSGKVIGVWHGSGWVHVGQEVHKSGESLECWVCEGCHTDWEWCMTGTVGVREGTWECSTRQKRYTGCARSDMGIRRHASAGWIRTGMREVPHKSGRVHGCSTDCEECTGPCKRCESQECTWGLSAATSCLHFTTIQHQLL